MAKWLDSGDLVPYEDQVGGHKFTKEKPLLGLYNNENNDNDINHICVVHIRTIC